MKKHFLHTIAVLGLVSAILLVPVDACAAKKTTSSTQSSTEASSSGTGTSGKSVAKKKTSGKKTTKKKSSNKKTGTQTSGAAAAPAAQSTSAETALTIAADVNAVSDDAADTLEQSLFTVVNYDRTRIINYAGESNSDTGVRYLSMAGGQERASAWSVTFRMSDGTAADASALNGTQSVQIGMTLQTAMNGRTLRTGESLQAFYDIGNGFYYKVPTTVSDTSVVMSVPALVNADGTGEQYLILVITSGSWSPSSGYDYLAIGNSITMHPRQSYWPDAMGMGATRQQYDYYHIVSSALETSCTQNGQAYNSAALNYAIWEISTGTRESVLYILDPYLSKDLELVTIQLGENAIPDAAGFAQDLPELIEYIQKKAPNARIVLVGNFWNDATETAAKLQCAQAYGLSYVDLSAISVDPYVTNVNSAYVFGNELAYDANGVGHRCEKDAVKLHPNNSGMRYIAQSILQVLGQ